MGLRYRIATGAMVAFLAISDLVGASSATNTVDPTLMQPVRIPLLHFLVAIFVPAETIIAVMTRYIDRLGARIDNDEE